MQRIIEIHFGVSGFAILLIQYKIEKNKQQTTKKTDEVVYPSILKSV